MAIGSGQALLLRALAEGGDWGNVNSVCELGSQVPLAVELTDLFEAFGKLPLKGKYSAKEFYEYLEIANYTSIDFNEMHDSLAFDLNKNLRVDYNYSASFDLITNYGTSNVVFNQYEVFRNVHQLCRKGGYMLHTLATQGWGGQWFFKYNTNFVEDLAAANDYEILYLEAFLRLKPYFRKDRTASIQQIRTLCSFIESKIKGTDSMKHDINPVDLTVQHDLKHRTDVAEAIASVGKGDALFNVTLACILKKKNDNEFVTPILRMYRKYGE